MKAGVDPERLSRMGHGEADPVADNSTAEGRALNRRVVVSGSLEKREMERGGKK